MKGPRTPLLLCLVLLFLIPACGKKGPPFLPKGKMPLAVRDLKAEWADKDVLLTGRIAAGPGEERFLQEVKAYRVSEAWYPVESPPCEGCPLDYTDYRDVPAKTRVGSSFSVEFPFDGAKGIYFFNVRLIGFDGVLGPPSDTAKLTAE